MRIGVSAAVALGLWALASSQVLALEAAPVERFLDAFQEGKFQEAHGYLTPEYGTQYSPSALESTSKKLAEEIGTLNGYVLSPASPESPTERRARLRLGVRSVETLFLLSPEGRIACWVLDPRLALRKNQSKDPSELAQHLRETFVQLRGGPVHLRYPVPGPPSCKILLIETVPGDTDNKSPGGRALQVPGGGTAERWSQGLTLSGAATAVLHLQSPTVGQGGDAVFGEAARSQIQDAAAVLQDGRSKLGLDFGQGPLLLLTFSDSAPRVVLALRSEFPSGAVMVCPPAPPSDFSVGNVPHFAIFGGAGKGTGTSDLWAGLLSGRERCSIKSYPHLTCPLTESGEPSHVLCQDILLWARAKDLSAESTDSEFGQGVFGVPVPKAFQVRGRGFLSECEKLYPAADSRPWGREPSYSPDGLYIPKDLEECFAELTRLLSPEDMASFKKEKEAQACTDFHMGLGMWMRNNWGLWAGSRLGFYFNDMGVFHPDDMSSIILHSFHRKLNGQEIQLDKQVEFFKAYWEKQQDVDGPSSGDKKAGAALQRLLK